MYDRRATRYRQSVRHRARLMQRFGARHASVEQAPYKTFVRKAPDPYRKSRLGSACIQLYSSRYKIFQGHGLSPTVRPPPHVMGTRKCVWIRSRKSLNRTSNGPQRGHTWSEQTSKYEWPPYIPSSTFFQSSSRLAFRIYIIVLMSSKWWRILLVRKGPSKISGKTLADLI